jgi:O-antigen/teichoic acid export membrane protein
LPRKVWRLSSLKSITKNLSAGFSSHFVSILQQFALTPLWLSRYGAAGFGEWITLSASVSYLGTLDFGIQTFVNQDLTVRYHRGDMESFHVQQSTALRMLLGMALTVGTLALVALVLPIEHWLKMDGSGSGPAVSAIVVRGTVFVLALQVLSNIVFGFFTGQFMVLGKAYIGQYWSNAKNAAQIIFAIPCLLLHTSFMVVAIAQLSALLICMCGALFTLFRLGRDIFPTLRYWDGPSVSKILKPSGYFALIYSSNFLVYQVPMLILQRSVGPVSVAIFSVTRTIFSMTRNVMNSFTQAIGPEVTVLYARRDWPKLSRLYDYSERVVYALIPIANLGTLVLGPVLAKLWLRNPHMFVLNIFVLCASVSIVTSAKEHKFQFQFSTNTHRELGRFMFATYVALVALWLILIPRFGIMGLLGAWFAVELSQVLYIMYLNAKFFAHHAVLHLRYPVRMSLLSIAGLAGTFLLLPHTALLPIWEQMGLALAVGFVLLALDIPLFNLVPLWGTVQGAVARKMAARA